MGDKLLIGGALARLLPAALALLLLAGVCSAQCDGLHNLTTSSGVITDGSGLANYTGSQTCQWAVSSAPGTVVSFTFRDFDTECGWDFVWVYDGDNAGAPLLGIFSGTWLASQPLRLPALSSSSNVAFVVFIADMYVTGFGFDIDYIASACAFNCNNRGACAASGVCTCIAPYSGRYCEIDNSQFTPLGPCDSGETSLCMCSANFTLTQDIFISQYRGGRTEVFTPRVFCNTSDPGLNLDSLENCLPCTSNDQIWESIGCPGGDSDQAAARSASATIFVYAFLFLLVFSICGLVAVVLLRFRRPPPHTVMLHAFGPREGDLRPAAPIPLFNALLAVAGATAPLTPFPLVYLEAGTTDPLPAVVIELPRDTVVTLAIGLPIQGLDFTHSPKVAAPTRQQYIGGRSGHSRRSNAAANASASGGAGNAGGSSRGPYGSISNNTTSVGPLGGGDGGNRPDDSARARNGGSGESSDIMGRSEGRVDVHPVPIARPVIVSQPAAQPRAAPSATTAAAANNDSSSSSSGDTSSSLDPQPERSSSS
eukprot:c3968_g1_i1.p1 GENE.c3968_g1_i1~~c3968_g1_i1.p1  ORF type:complete len:538 (-),score=60.53 c3968_g1_i1:29-1642(-)